VINVGETLTDKNRSSWSASSISKLTHSSQKPLDGLYGVCREVIKVTEGNEEKIEHEANHRRAKGEPFFMKSLMNGKSWDFRRVDLLIGIGFLIAGVYNILMR
jgi:hypothetical protein